MRKYFFDLLSKNLDLVNFNLYNTLLRLMFLNETISSKIFSNPQFILISNSSQLCQINRKKFNSSSCQIRIITHKIHLLFNLSLNLKFKILDVSCSQTLDKGHVDDYF